MIVFKGLIFDPRAAKQREESFHRKQKYIDREVLRQSDPYVPRRLGFLKDSGKLGTVIGSGNIRYIAPYGKPQYYNNKGYGKEGLNALNGNKGLRGSYWFERMKADHKEEILEGVKKIK